jgi:hypothetical protein
MANSVSYQGQEYALLGDGVSSGSIARLATQLRLFTSASTPDKDGSGFTYLTDGVNGYNHQAITVANWTGAGGAGGQDFEIQLDDFTFTASGGSLANIAGAAVVDASAAVLAWWERTSPITLNDGDAITADDLLIRGI